MAVAVIEGSSPTPPPSVLPSALQFCWFAKYYAFNNWARIVDFSNGANSDNIIIANVASSRELTFSLRIGSAGTELRTRLDLAEGAFQHYCARIDHTGTATIFQQGVQVSQKGSMNVPKVMSRAVNYIGESAWANDAFFEGGEKLAVGAGQ